MTASGSAEGLYDALFALESRHRGALAYPIHKRLRLDTGRADVYDWVAEQVGLRPTDRVLDAGCGVGFGTIRLAERGAAHVTGVTLSERELARARSAAARSRASGRIELRRASFDDLPPLTFDAVVAVESLKHSVDLAATLDALVGSLAPGGRLVIVEDVLVGDAGSKSACRVASDWSLTKHYRQVDYLDGLGDEGCRVVDLTAAVPVRNRILLAGQLAALGAALGVSRGQRAEALRAFRGGLHLERLYAAGAVRYQAFIHRMGGAEGA